METTALETAEAPVTETLACDSEAQMDREAATVRRFFNGENASMMGGWT